MKKYKNISMIFKKIMIGALIISISLSVFVNTITLSPKKAEAVPMLGVPIDTFFNFHSIMDNLKEFVLNKLAVSIANQILQRMTASVVQWINSGFEGSPAFLTNPEAFFLDVADQVTGQFIYETGALSELCSPFSFDIRLNLALDQAYGGYAVPRYRCTLDTIIKNTQNAIATAGQNSGVTVSSRSGGATMQDFLDGDFYAGGWEGFIALTTEPQNNAMGAYIMAESDLRTQIAQKQSAINTDLNRGNGFLSWQKCVDVTDAYTSGYADPGELGLSVNQNNQIKQEGNQVVVIGQTNLNKSTSFQKKIYQENGVTKTKYQNCQTQTPGSVIGDSLQRQLNVPTDKLVLVKTISDSIDAILGALTNQMLTQGLAALSGRGSSVGGGGSQSYLAQLSAEAENRNNLDVTTTKGRTASSTNSVVSIAEGAIGTYEKIMTMMTDSKNRLLTAKQCFADKLSSMTYLNPSDRSFAQSQMNTIDLTIFRTIDPIIASSTEKRLEIQRQLDRYRTATESFYDDTYVPEFTLGDINSRFRDLETVINTTAESTRTGIDSNNDADSAYRSAQTLQTELNNSAKTFQDSCNGFPYNNRRY